jgi:hypothetical protein
VGLGTIFYCLRFETSLFVASYDSQGHGGGIGPRLHTEMNPPPKSKSSQNQSHIATGGRSISKSWCRAPSAAHDQIFITLWLLRSLFSWGALPDERTGLSFVYAAGPRQRSHSRVRVPWDLRPYFIVSDSRLPFSSPPTTRRVTVEVFDPASTVWQTLLLQCFGEPCRTHLLQQYSYCVLSRYCVLKGPLLWISTFNDKVTLRISKP